MAGVATARSGMVRKPVWQERAEQEGSRETKADHTGPGGPVPTLPFNVSEMGNS